MNQLSSRLLNATVIIAGLGYFVDMFDFFLYNMVRGPSLTDLGLSESELTDAGFLISNCQMAGVLLGSFAWGILGDKYGRKNSLFASIILYSLASIACGFVKDANSYAILRFLAGFGIAGELGAGVTLIAERLNQRKRGMGITFFITLGFLGVLAAVVIVQFLPWRTVYIIGGIAGLILLLARSLLPESSLYVSSAERKDIFRGKLITVLRQPKKLRKYIAAICVIVPGTFAPQIIWTLSPEIGAAYGVHDIKANIVLGIGFTCVLMADFAAIWLSEWLKSRRNALKKMHYLATAGFIIYMLVPQILPMSYGLFLFLNGFLGLTMGLWVLGIIVAAEQFGTNIRATVATTIPSFSRAMTIPMNLAFAHMKGVDPVFAVVIIGATIFMLSFWGCRQLDETYGKDLDFVE